MTLSKRKHQVKIKIWVKNCLLAQLLTLKAGQQLRVQKHSLLTYKRIISADVVVCSINFYPISIQFSA